MLMQTKHKVSIAALIAIVAVVVGLGALGAFVYHNNVTPASMPNENSKLSDQVAVSTQGQSQGPPKEASHMTDSVAVKMNGVSDFQDQYTTPMQVTNVDDFLKTHPGSFVGLVTKTFRHADGTIFAKFTDHNTRTVQGVQCALIDLFGLASQSGGAFGNFNASANACNTLIINTSTTHFNGFNTIFLVNGSTGAAAMTLNGSDTIATTKIGGTRASSADGAITTPTNQGGPISCTVAPTTTYNQITCTSGTYTFTGDRAAGTAIRGVLLGNSTSATATSIFAENGFSAVPVASSDTLTVTWTISLT